MATPQAVTVPPSRGAQSFTKRLQSGDEIAHLLTFLFASSVLLIALLLVFYLWKGSALSLHKFGFDFLSSSTWDPVNEKFGALPFIFGTLVTSALALLISVPLGVGAAIFLAELAPARLSSALTFLVELLAAVPSVIYGLLAIFSLIPILRLYIQPFLKNTLGLLPLVGDLFSGPMYGTSMLAAGLILAIMTFPFIISISRQALLEVPREQREAALALGATKWESTWDVVVPFAKLGIVGSIFLALARALGETMAVTMVIGNDPKIKTSLFAPASTIAAVIANEFTEATGDIHLAALVELGLVLFVITMIINAGARLLIIATTKKGSKR